MKRLTGLLLLVLVSLLFVSSVYAEVKAGFGAALRLRQEIWDNVVDFKTLNRPDRNFFRLRTSVWGKVDATKDLGAYLRLTNETKYYTGPFKPNAPRNNDRLDEDEFIIDNLYFDAKNIFGLPVDVRIGRQDFLGPDMYGEGFLLLDGTPGDGSRTFYFNAAKATWKINQKNSVDLVFISDPQTDIYLPSMYPAHTGALYADHKRLLTTAKEDGIVVYGRNKITDSLAVEPYYIYKTEGATSTAARLGLNTIGARVVYAINKTWKAGGEYAHQFGEYTGGTDRVGDGGYVFVTGKFENTPWKPELDVRYVYLSGDDPNTAKREGWDPLFSRAPYWNELIIYSLPNETLRDSGPIPGYWTNMQIYKAGVKLYFTPQTNLGVAYQYLKANESTSGLTAAMFTNRDKERGHLPTALLSHQFSKKVDGLLQYEYFIPGNFYSAQAKNATFFRWQLQVKL
ncbi:MAG: alginate export family protein [Nitrospirae bacterium]|nr:alginate export family protein [Nitrospirota bacterium]